jgi:hypothetical protein
MNARLQRCECVRGEGHLELWEAHRVDDAVVLRLRHESSERREAAVDEQLDVTGLWSAGNE